MSEKVEVEFELESDVVEMLEQDGVDKDAIVNGLIHLERARQMWEDDE